MRLVKSLLEGSLESTKDLDEDVIPPYAILSHTWGADEEEVTFKDFVGGSGKQKGGYEKLVFCAKQARRDGLQHFWVDTCCIDKSNGVELNTAIKSMFRWYAKASKCYVYLSDVSNMPSSTSSGDNATWQSEFRRCRWLTRGWTLQELLAPKVVEFYDKTGQKLGDKRTLEHHICDITGIPAAALRGRDLSSFSIEERFSWQHSRKTKKPEDEAYSLSGICGVSMIPVYGEGRDKAMARLRREVDEVLKGECLRNLAKSTSSSRPHIHCVVTQAVPKRVDFSLPFEDTPVVGVEKFVAREKELEGIHAELIGDGRRRTVILHGLGGIGKTQLAIAYAKRHKDSYSAVFWLDIRDEISVKRSFGAIARRILRHHPSALHLSGVDLAGSLDEICEAVMAWLSMSDNTRWLAIYDNYDPAVTDVREFLPVAYQGSVIVTTRSPQVKIGRAIAVRKLTSVQESVEILSSLSRRELSADDPDVMALLQRFDGLPLALAQTGSFLDQHTVSIAEFLSLYDSSWSQLHKNDPGLETYEDRTAVALDTTCDMLTSPEARGKGGYGASDDDTDISSATGLDSRSVTSITSLASSTTSLGETFGEDVIQEFTSLLFCTSDVMDLHIAAIKDSSIGKDRFVRNVRRLISAYGKDLQFEAETTLERQAARFAKSTPRAARAASAIAETVVEKLSLDKRNKYVRPRFNDIWDVSTDLLPTDNYSEPNDEYQYEENEDEDSEDEDLNDLTAVKDFLLQSKAYQEFKLKLFDFVHQPYRARISKAFERSALNAFDEIPQPERDELACVAARLVTISHEEPTTTLDSMKGLVEGWMRETWDWWPLQNRKQRLKNGFARVKWPCVCGAERHIDVPTSVAAKLSEAFKSAPMFLRGQILRPIESFDTTSRPLGSNGSNAPSSSTNTASPTGLSSLRQGQSNQAPLNTSINNNQVPTGQSVSQQHKVSSKPPSIAPPISKYVFLGAKCGDEYPVASIIVNGSTDTQFFQELKEQYLSLRGPWRRLLSWWRYHHCDFYSFQKYAHQTCTVRRECFPDHTNNDYEFQPRPMQPVPPLEDHEFHARFYKSCAQPHSWHRHQCSRFVTTDTQALSFLPKRKNALELNGDKREEFWGIYARERRAFAWVLGYFLLCNTPGVVFFFLWLFALGNGSDLSNAAVPLTLSVTLTGSFIALLYSDSRDVDRK